MARITSVVLGDYFERFVETAVLQGRYENANEVVLAGLRLLEEQENQINVLSMAIQEGFNSGVAKDFYPNQHLKAMKENKWND